jgi:molybdate transport system substrate-binding protein
VPIRAGLLVLSMAAAVLGTAGQTTVLVSAAISLTDALTGIERIYRHSGGDEVRFNFAGSNVLARQIVNGAPADLFISADAAQMDYAASRGVIEGPIALLKNRLAVVTPSGKGASVPDAAALARVRRIAIGDPAGVPAGVYARRYLQKIGIWPAIQGRLLPLANVRAALNAVESGGADAGIVYESDAAASRQVALAFIVDGPDAPEIVYPAALVKTSANKSAAARFLAFLQGAEAAVIFRQYRLQPAARTY